jgi:serine/threonine protein kinase
MMERAKPIATPGADPGSPVRADAQRDPWIGQAINARYQVSRRLAAGPSGTLYIAHEGETGAEVTLKLLPVGIALNDDGLGRLRDELSVTSTVARIRPSVAIVHDCDRAAAGRPFLVLEPLDGRSLADVIGQEGALPVERALRLAFEIADGLQAAHNLVLVHGALAAEHVLVGADDTVKLTGFEVARLGRAGPRPEGLTERADIQALGLLLMHMLTAAVPSRSEGSGAHPERKLGGEVPAAVRELVMQALDSRSPEPGSPDMGSVANALWVELYRMAEHPIPTAPRPARAVWPRVPWRTVGIGALIVAVIALGAWVTRYRATAPPPVTSVTQPVPAAQSPPVPVPTVPEPAAVERPAEVVVSPPMAPPAPPVPPPLPRTEPIPPAQPVVKSTPPVTPEGAPVTPRATPPLPAPPATRTPPPAAPESAQGTPRVRATPPPAPARVTPPSPAPAERPEATSPVPVRPAPESGAARQAPRPERDAEEPSAIIDWLLKESPRQQR